jgi:hypothetical protein
MDLHHIKTMENQLDKALIKYSELQANNLALRKQIDIQRKQMRKQIHVNGGYKKEIDHIKDNCKKMNQVIMQR